MFNFSTVIKKASVLLCAAAIMFALALPVSAADTSLELSPSSFSYKEGDTVEVSLRVKDAARIASGNIFVAFDDEYLEFVSSVETDNVKRAGLSLECGLVSDGKEITCGFMHVGDGIPEDLKDMVLINMVFKAKKDGSGGLEIDRAVLFDNYDKTQYETGEWPTQPAYEGPGDEDREMRYPSYDGFWSEDEGGAKYLSIPATGEGVSFMPHVLFISGIAGFAFIYCIPNKKNKSNK